MIDKEIIIDVSKCPDKINDDCMAFPVVNDYGDLMCYPSCETRTECHYRLKQKLQRKEQECEELKEELQTSIDDHAYAVELEKDIERYEQALEKIEEIANTHTSVHCLNPDCDCNNCHDDITDYGKTCINKGRLEILATINEVKND